MGGRKRAASRNNQTTPWYQSLKGDQKGLESGNRFIMLPGFSIRVSFWHDHSCRNVPLKILFRRLYNLARPGEPQFVIMCNGTFPPIHLGTFSFSCNVNDWKIDDFTTLLSMLNTCLLLLSCLSLLTTKCSHDQSSAYHTLAIGDLHSS